MPVPPKAEVDKVPRFFYGLMLLGTVTIHSEKMKKALLLFTMILSFNLLFSQDLDMIDNVGFTTIGYFYSKKLIGIKGKIL